MASWNDTNRIGILKQPECQTLWYFYPHYRSCRRWPHWQVSVFWYTPSFIIQVFIVLPTNRPCLDDMGDLDGGSMALTFMIWFRRPGHGKTGRRGDNHTESARFEDGRDRLWIYRKGVQKHRHLPVRSSAGQDQVNVGRNIHNLTLWLLQEFPILFVSLHDSHHGIISKKVVCISA